MPAELSTDLLELIVDELAGEKSALSACALASSVLRRPARHHLFSNVSVTSVDRATALADILDGDPALGASILSLHATYRPPVIAWHSAVGHAGLICALLPRLPRLATLKFSAIKILAFGRVRGAGALAAVLPASLRRLAFAWCQLANGADFITLITAAPGLRSLGVISCDWFPPVISPEGVTYASTLKLEDFQLVSKRGIETQIDHGWLSIVSTHGLISLTATLYGSTGVPFWQARIDQAGAVMRKLVLVHYNLSGEPWSTLSLAIPSSRSYVQP
jgi:hypothetical protein